MSFLFSRNVGGKMYDFYRDDARPGIHADADTGIVRMSGPATVDDIQTALYLIFEQENLSPVEPLRVFELSSS